MATANPVQLGPSPSGPVRGAGPTVLKLDITFRARLEAHDRSWRCSWDLGVCIQFSIHEMNRWRGSSESHTIRVTLSLGNPQTIHTMFIKILRVR